MLLKQAEQQPVLFILEDLHWTDPTTLELLDLLIDQTPMAFMCALLTCRPEFQPTWSHRSNLTEVTVSRLSQPQIARIAEQVAGEKRLPDEIVQQLVDKTDGVPLYVEEMTKSVLESGILKETNGHYELSGPITSLAIPATLQDSLMARLDRLMTAKVVAQLGATIGRQFGYDLLYAVAQIDEPTLQRELGRLVESELVYQRGLPPNATYTFKHALIQDTAYESLLRSTRQGYHQRIAQVLEEQFPETAETQPELLAHHFTEAGMNEQAVAYWYEAGQKASERSAYVEAISHLTKGLDLLVTLPDSPERAQQELNLQISLGPLLIATQGQAAPEVGDAFNRARELCQQVADVPQFFRVLFGLWHFHVVRAELQTVQKLSEELLNLAQDIREPSYLVSAHWGLGGARFLLGDFDTASEQFQQSIALYHPQQHHTNTFLFGFDFGVFSLCFSPHALWHLGYPDQAVAMSRKAIELARDLSHPLSLAVALAYTSMSHQFCQDSHTVEVCTNEVMTLCAEQGFTYYLAWGTIFRGWAWSAQGQSEEGISQMRQGLTALQSTGGGLRVPYYLTLLAEAYGKVDQTEEGLTLVSEALVLIDKNDERWYEAEIHCLQGQLLLQQSPDNATEAETCFHKALDIARSQQAKSLELRAATSLARLWQSQGKRDEARELLEPVYSWFTEGFDTADLIDAKALLDELSEGSS
jgi:predicted ATPase